MTTFSVFYLSVLSTVQCFDAGINYDLLAGDLKFYKQSLVFALRENEVRGKEMLWLIEELLSPAMNDNDDNSTVNSTAILINDNTSCGCKTSPFLTFVRITESPLFVHIVIVMGMICFLLFTFTVIFILLISPYICYKQVNNVCCRKPIDESEDFSIQRQNNGSGSIQCKQSTYNKLLTTFFFFYEIITYGQYMHKLCGII